MLDRMPNRTHLQLVKAINSLLRCIRSLNTRWDVTKLNDDVDKELQRSLLPKGSASLRWGAGYPRPVSAAKHDRDVYMS